MNWEAINSKILLSTIRLHEPYCSMPYPQIHIIRTVWGGMEQETRRIFLMQYHDDRAISSEYWEYLEDERRAGRGT